jgi:hypothetical protein
MPGRIPSALPVVILSREQLVAPPKFGPCDLRERDRLAGNAMSQPDHEAGAARLEFKRRMQQPARLQREVG